MQLIAATATAAAAALSPTSVFCHTTLPPSPPRRNLPLLRLCALIAFSLQPVGLLTQWIQPPFWLISVCVCNLWLLFFVNALHEF